MVGVLSQYLVLIDTFSALFNFKSFKFSALLKFN